MLEQVFEKNPETVKIAYKHLPMPSNDMARPAALASMAANEQGKFWEFHDKLFAEPRILPSTFDRIAEEIGLDLERFKKDMYSPRLQAILTADIEEAGSVGITGTPTIFINGRKLKQRSLEGFQMMIDDELRKIE